MYNWVYFSTQVKRAPGRSWYPGSAEHEISFTLGYSTAPYSKTLIKSNGRNVQLLLYSVNTVWSCCSASESKSFGNMLDVKWCGWFKEGGEKGCANPSIRYDLLTKSALILNFRPESEIRAKIFVLHAKSKIQAQKIDDTAFHCSCRIQKSVNISLWIRNPSKNIFKIRRSVRLFTPLFKRGGFRYLCSNRVNLSSSVGFESSENWTRMTWGAWGSWGAH